MNIKGWKDAGLSGSSLSVQILRRMRQEDHRVKASLGYHEFKSSLNNLLRTCLKMKSRRGLGDELVAERLANDSEALGSKLWATEQRRGHRISYPNS